MAVLSVPSAGMREPVLRPF